MNYCGPYNPLNEQVIYDKNENIIKYIQNPTGKTDAICGQHDIDYALSRNINDKHNNERYIKQNIHTYNKTYKISKYKINDLVRISLKRRDVFDKLSGNIKWSEELFKIYDIDISDVIMYKLKDMNDEIIEGSFYEKESQKTKNTSEEYIIEKIIKTKNNKIYVKWRGYSNNFNSWIDKNNIIKYA